ncbi:MAG: hypothetical protein AAGH46_03660 [Bacteroidota bacterium]
MKALQELVQLIDHHSSTSIVKSYIKQAPTSKQAQLFLGIREGRFRNDQEACQAIYGPNQESTGYYKLKHDLRERLLNTVIQICPKVPGSGRSMLRGYKYLATARILLSQGRRRAAVRLLQTVLLFCRQNEQTLLEIEALRLLRYHYGIILGNQIKQERISKQISYLEKRLSAENQADHWWEKIQSHFVGSQISDQAILDEAKKYATLINESLEEVHSKKLVHRSFFLQLIHQMGYGHYQQALSTCQQAIKHFHTNEAIDLSKRRSYHFQALECHLRLGNQQDFLHCFEHLNPLVPSNSSSWFRLQLLFCQFNLVQGQFQEAFWVWENVEAAGGIQDLFPDLRESWFLTEAYLAWLLGIGIVDAAKNCRLHTFRPGKFLNEVPVLSRDKKGYNIPILIAQILHLLARRESDKSLNRIKALYKYSKRHLHEERFERLHTLIQLFLRIPRARFRRRYVEPKAELLYRQLLEDPSLQKDRSPSLEIIPYEYLWPILLENGLKY